MIFFKKTVYFYGICVIIYHVKLKGGFSVSKLDICAVKDKCENGFKTVAEYIDTAKDISVHPKFSASLKISSKKNGNSYFNKGVKVDEELTLWKIIGMVFAFIAALIVASITVNCIINSLTGKKKYRKAVCRDFTPVDAVDYEEI